MTLSRLVAGTLVCAVTATPVSADVTLRWENSGEMLGSPTQETTEYRKGLRWRTDMTSNGVSATTIMDLSSGRMIMLWHHSKTAEVFQPKQISELFSRDNVPPVTSITPTTQSRQIAGWTCIVHRVKSSYSMRKLDMVPPTMVMEGTMCLVKNGPGHADFAAFYLAGGKNPVMYDPDLGIPFATAMTMGFKGDDPASGVVQVGSYTTEVISVSTEPIPDSMFEIPADYTVTKR
jgi:Domain of unknown function (DUF4412)